MPSMEMSEVAQVAWWESGRNQELSHFCWSCKAPPFRIMAMASGRPELGLPAVGRDWRWSRGPGDLQEYQSPLTVARLGRSGRPKGQRSGRGGRSLMCQVSWDRVSWHSPLLGVGGRASRGMSWSIRHLFTRAGSAHCPPAVRGSQGPQFPLPDSSLGWEGGGQATLEEELSPSKPRMEP